jgi:hypothetical protein
MRFGTGGQVVVEVALILPVFLAMVFSIMEIGYVSFRVIVLNHATFEVARIAGMTWMMPGSGRNNDYNMVMRQILTDATVECGVSPTGTPLADPQSGTLNFDLLCTGTEDVRLIFPISSILLAKPAGSGTRRINAQVYMPVEQPLAR